MKLNKTFTYTAILVVYIFIIVLMFVPNTEVMGIWTLFFWFFLSHIFLFSTVNIDLTWFMLAICASLMLCSIVFIALYFVKNVNAQDNSVSVLPEPAENSTVVRNWKIIFIVGEFLLFIFLGAMAYLQSRAAEMSEVRAGRKLTLISSVPTTPVVFFANLGLLPLFIIFLNAIIYFSLYYGLASKGGDFATNANLLSFKWAFSVVLVLTVLLYLWLSKKDFPHLMTSSVNVIGIVIFLLSVYSLDMSKWLYNKSAIVI